MSQLPSGALSFRPHRSMLIIGAIGFVSFSIVAVIFFVFPNGFLKRSARHPELETFISYTLFLGLLLLYFWEIVFYFRKWLLLTNKEVIQRGFFRTQSFAIDSVTNLQWPQSPSRKWPHLPASSFDVQTESEKIKIDFGSFTKDQGREIILFFRDRIIADKQDNWAQFAEHSPCLSPPRYLALSRASKPTFSRIFFLITAAIWSLFAADFIYYWSTGLGTENLIIGIICSVAGIGFLLRYLTYKTMRNAGDNKAC